MSVTLVLGGARSGKSSFAEKTALRSCASPIYLATARAGDDEMAQRICQHQLRRGSAWRLIEEPLDIAPVLASTAEGSAILVDCLSIWLSNLMEADRNIEATGAELSSVLERTRADVVLVANEVGLAIVPDNALARRYRDEAGLLNQRVAAAASDVVFMAAGLPMVLKRDGSVIHGE